MSHSESVSRVDEETAGKRLAQLTLIEAAWQHRQAPLHAGDRMLWIGVACHPDAPPPGAVWNAPVYTARDGRYFYETGGWNAAQQPGAPPTRNAVR